MASLEVTVLTFIKQEYEANKAAVLAGITAAEGGIQTLVDNALNDFKPSGVVGAVYALVKPQVIADVNNFITTEGSPETVYELIDSELAKALAAAGG